MKKLIIVAILICSGFISKAQTMPSANAPDFSNVLKMSGSLFTRNTFQMGYEKFFNPTTSFYLMAGINFKDSDYERDWGVRTEAQMRFHVYTVINPSSSHRLYFSPYLMNHYLTLERRDYSYSGSAIWKSDTFDALSGGMLFGWSYTFANRINMDIYTGGGLRKTFNYEQSDGYNDSVFDYGYSGIVPRLGVDIGFWF